MIFFKIAYLLCLFTFLALPPATLGIWLWRRDWLERGWRKFLTVAALSISGWLLINGSLYFHSLYKWRLLAPYNSFEDMPPDVLQVAQGGPTGAAYVFALFFGWLYMPIYFCLWIPLLLPIAVAKKLFKQG